MRRTHVSALGIAVFLAVPAVASGGAATVYEGDANGDPQATIELRITDGSDRKVVKAITKGIPYSGGSCSTSGRTPRVKAEGSAKVKGNGEFRFVESGEAQDPLKSGQLNVVGDVQGKKITGKMKFTFGKDGCDSEVLGFTARR